MRPYRLLTPAAIDLSSILDYLDGHSRSVAGQFLGRLDRRLVLLSEFPDSGRRRPEFGHDDLRYLTFESYIVAYFPNTAPLSIAAILHGSRDLASLLKVSR
jgi:plasmid stabilization system protein ParE